jgi:hypothetical protein
VTTTAPAGEETGTVVVVRAGAVVGEDDGRVVLVVWPEPRGDGDVGEVVPVAGSGPVVVVVEDVELEEEVEGSVEVSPEPVPAGAVVVVVEDESVVVEGSVVVVVPGSGAGSVAGVAAVVVEVVSVVSARAGAAGTQTTATNTPVMARPRRMRLDNTGFSRSARTATLWSTSGRTGCSSPKGMFQNDDGNRADRVGSIKAVIHVQPLQEPPSRGAHSGSAGAAGPRAARA